MDCAQGYIKATANFIPIGGNGKGVVCSKSLVIKPCVEMFEHVDEIIGLIHVPLSNPRQALVVQLSETVAVQMVPCKTL